MDGRCVGTVRLKRDTTYDTVRLKPDTAYDSTADTVRVVGPAYGAVVASAFRRTVIRARHGLLAAALALIVSPLVAGQDQAPPPSNLQVFPKEISRQDLLAAMQQFTRALGVQCTYCHAQAPPELLTPEQAQAAAAQSLGRGRGRGQGPPPIDFASDEKPTKHIARAMLAMMNDANARIAALGKPAGETVKVQYVTCHRGITDPQPLTDLLWNTMMGKGDGAAVASYRSLRNKYFGTEAYDFREPVLVSLADRSLSIGKPDDALAWLQLNVEFYPKSAESYLRLARAHAAKRDPVTARKDLEKVLELDPSNVEAKREIERLGKGR